jgi:hypothetical protein
MVSDVLPACAAMTAASALGAPRMASLLSDEGDQDCA